MLKSQTENQNTIIQEMKSLELKLEQEKDKNK
jgi:hypothetical protein